MLIGSILTDERNFDTAAKAEFAQYVAQRISKNKDAPDSVTEQALNVANDITRASLDARSNKELSETHPHLHAFILADKDMQALCGEIAEVIINKSEDRNFTTAFKAMKVLFFG
jgi:cell fate (sporulation/competence/biofilm development) regulator YlbF (YheA/YmcA/DUF963 family)